MKVNNVTKWIVIDHEASSLFDVIAGEDFKNKNVGMDEWLSLMDDSRLQEKCNKNEFNVNTYYTYNSKTVKLKVWIGIIADNQSHCKHCNSCLGFGTLVRGCDGEIRKTTCGNIAICDFLGNKNTAAFGYIFVQ